MTGKKKEIRPLTKAEEAVMQALWQHEAASVREIIEAMPAPKPHYNTVNTLLKILSEKGFVVGAASGGANQFKALVSRDECSRRSVKQLLKTYFAGSFTDMVSAFAAGPEVDIAELEAILKNLKKAKK